jgi:[protein-PII] uridylyltransferase
VLKIEHEKAYETMTNGDARNALAKAGEDLKSRFEAGESVVELVRARAIMVDELLVHLWDGQVEDGEVALLAVGGYGRGELHPGSDIDVMILLPESISATTEESLSSFVTSLWDVGLEIGHSVRTLEQCTEEAGSDLTIATTLMESRLLVGPQQLFRDMQALIGPDRMWPSPVFFAEKRKEQINRHHRYHDTAYNLEPNIKGSPGGLRDIQLIGWVAKRHFGAATLAELVDHKFLTHGQLKRLEDGEHFLWRIRFALHVLTGRREDRLLFDHQRQLAEMLGYEDATYTLAVEQLMQRYYRTVMELSRLNEMLLQQFEEAILMDPSAPAEALNERFEVKNGFLKTVDEQVFERDPSAMLELFLLLQDNPELSGVSAYTIGSIKRHLHLIDDEFRQNPRNHRLFLNILRAQEGVTHELRRMNLYGVLGLYIPSFGRIVGRMQYDLFHAYTVDEHTLFVVSYLRRFALQRYNDEFPHCSEVMQSLQKPEIVYLGGLFHDIAKGRGGDHSELGAVDAEAFCLEHGMEKSEARTVAWLVRQHLILSTTAQKKDLGDPDVINDFAELVGDRQLLDYLYVLTIADVRGTDPKLWNSWKAQLFRDLYELTKRALRRGLLNPLESEQLVLEKKEKAHRYLDAAGIGKDNIAKVWQQFNDNYYLRYRSSEIAWHSEWLAASDMERDIGLLDVRRRRSGDGVEAVLHTPQIKHTFAHVTAVLDELGMTIVDARIVPLDNGNSIDTYVFMESDERVDIDEDRINKIRRALTRILTADDDKVAKVTRGVTRQARMFSTPTRVNFSPSTSADQTVFELVTADRPGLLSKVGQVFIEQGIDITSAKIMTIGERAEDVFYIQDLSGKSLTESALGDLASALQDRLEQNKS